MNLATYTESQPQVRYFYINDTRADVIVNNFVETKTEVLEGENEQTFYVYETNSFSVDPTLLTKDDILNNIEKYLHYEKDKELPDSEKIAKLEEENKLLTQCILELSEVIYNG